LTLGARVATLTERAAPEAAAPEHAPEAEPGAARPAS
jgi:hypothetical protein